MLERRNGRISDRGVSLIEVVVAMVLLGILGTAVLAIVLQAQSQTVNNRARVAASNLAAREIDLVREQFMASDDGPLNLADEGVVTNPHSFGSAGSPLVVDGTPYTVKRSVAWNVTGSGGSACEGGSLVRYPTMSVQVEVTWPGMGSTKPVVNTTQLAPPKGVGLSTTSSFVAVKVTNSQGQPNAGRSVTVFRTSGGESRSGLTDSTGCAVVEVEPAAGSGTDYSARVQDAGHVDLGGDPAPVRNVGRIARGTLNSSVTVAYDRSVALRLRLVGGGATDADVNGSQVTVYKGGEYAGSSPMTTHVVSGLTTTVSGLWPGDYAAFFGTDVPAEIAFVTAMPGTSIDIDVQLAVARVTVTGQPANSRVLVVPGVETSCTAPTAREIDPTGGELLPGSWSFLALTDAYGCVSGPSSVGLEADTDTEIAWDPTELRVIGAPDGYGDRVWAVSNHTTSATCTPPTPATDAILIGAGADMTATLPAGDWYVFVTSGDSAPAGSDPCASAGLINVPYGQQTTLAWPSDIPGSGGRS